MCKVHFPSCIYVYMDKVKPDHELYMANDVCVVCVIMHVALQYIYLRALVHGRTQYVHMPRYAHKKIKPIRKREIYNLSRLVRDLNAYCLG